MKKTIKITKTTMSDANLIARIGAETFHETYSGMMNEQDLEAYCRDSFQQKKIENELSDPTVTYLLAYQESDLVGYAKFSLASPPSCVLTPTPGEVSRIYLRRDLQGTGYGFQIYESILELAKKAGCTGLWLSVWELNHKARAFYERVGFKKVGEQIFTVGSDHQKDDLLFLSLI